MEQRKTDFWDLAFQLREFLIRKDIDIDQITCHAFIFSHDNKVFNLSFGQDVD